MPGPEELDSYTQMMENAAAVLRKGETFSAELNSRDLEQLARAAVTQPKLITKVGMITVKIESITKVGMVTVNIEGGRPGNSNAVRAKIDVAGIEGTAKFGLFTKSFTVNRAQLEITNSPTAQKGQERLRVSPGIQAEPGSIMGVSVAGLLGGLIGDENINERFGTVFTEELREKGVTLNTYGLQLTERNTLQVSLTSRTSR